MEKGLWPGQLELCVSSGAMGSGRGICSRPKIWMLMESRLSRIIHSTNMRTGQGMPFPEGAKIKEIAQPWMRIGKMTQLPYKQKDPAAILNAARETRSQAMARLEPVHLLLPPAMPTRYDVFVARDLVEKQRHSTDAIRSQKDLERQIARLDCA